MKTRAAVLAGIGQKWTIEDVTLGKPGPHEVVIEMKAAGLCHSEEHMVSGEMVIPDEVRLEHGIPSQFPLIGGHEGAGVIVAMGSAVEQLEVGDHVATSFIPSCGVCAFCVRGRQYLCDAGADLLIKKSEPKHHLGGEALNTYSNLGTFAEYALVHEYSVVKIDQHYPLELVALLSCGVPTGWGSAVDRAGTRPGDVVAVIGVGGIGINAVQGAAAVGAKAIVAIDPVRFKRDKALEFGATHAVSSVDEARPLITQLSRGRMCERVIVAPSVVHGDIVGAALSITGKGGTCVATGLAPISQTTCAVSLNNLTLWHKELKGCLYGSLNPRLDIPMLLSLYGAGKLKLDELISRRYSLSEINNGYDDLRAGTILRGVITF